jgi:hypothetical protein
MAEGRPPSDSERDDIKRIEKRKDVREIADELVAETPKPIAPKPKSKSPKKP